MKSEYDMTDAKRGAVLPAEGKTRVTLYLNAAVLEASRKRAEGQGIGYQTLINETLKEGLGPGTAPVDAQTLRRVLREELARTT